MFIANQLTRQYIGSLPQCERLTSYFQSQELLYGIGAVAFAGAAVSAGSRKSGYTETLWQIALIPGALKAYSTAAFFYEIWTPNQTLHKQFIDC
jgi:hypothetical protein